MSAGPSCVAVLCARNEAAHLRRAIGDFLAQGIEVALIDHGSTDETAQVCREFAGRGLLPVRRLPWEGAFDLAAQLQAKRELVATLAHDWVIHADADEHMHTRRDGETLREGIARLDRAGYNAVNFEEFVFLPDADSERPPADCKRELLDYYFFAPAPQRLMRAWKRGAGLDNLASGGHLLSGEGLRVAPENFVLRHYIVLSQRHAVEKYTGRVFADGDLRRGWHQNRLGLSPRQLRMPPRSLLRRLSRWDQAELDRSDPQSLHFWAWPAATGEPAQAEGATGSGDPRG